MQFLWLNLYSWKYFDFLENIKKPSRKTLVFTPNPEMLLRASKNKEFLDILNQATYLTPDANGLYVGQMMSEGYWFLKAWCRTLFSRKTLEEEYGELIKGSDLTRDLIEYVSESQKRVLMIDNYRIETPKNAFEVRKQEIQSELPALFASRFPELKIEIFFDGETSPEAIAQIIQGENISFVFSCIGMKAQEERLIEIWKYLPDDTRVVWLGVGSSFDYLLGLQKRAPLLVQKLGLEWLYRLILDPRKRWKRIWDAVVEFPRMVKKSW